MHRCTSREGQVNSEKMRALVDRYIDAYNRMDVEGMLLTVHPDVKFRNISGGAVNAHANGAEEFRALAEQSKSVFSERRQTVQSFEPADNAAVASIAFRAVIARDLPNGWKKGQVLNLAGCSEFAFSDDRILTITDVS
jgi:hypothetical protein